MDSDNNEMEFMFNSPKDLGRQEKTRVDPVAQISPLQRYALAPGVGPKGTPAKMDTDRKWAKFRRLSQTKRNFSTFVVRGTGSGW